MATIKIDQPHQSEIEWHNQIVEYCYAVPISIWHKKQSPLLHLMKFQVHWYRHLKMEKIYIEGKRLNEPVGQEINIMWTSRDVFRTWHDIN